MHAALAEIAGLYRAATGVTVALNTGGSNTLARQIVEGAPVGLFLSADDLQMDVVERAGRLVPGTRAPLLTNELAVVVPHDAPAGFTLERLLEGRVSRLAMGSRPRCLPGLWRRWLEARGLAAHRADGVRHDVRAVLRGRAAVSWPHRVSHRGPTQSPVR